jgi:hypothetical protein
MLIQMACLELKLEKFWSDGSQLLLEIYGTAFMGSRMPEGEDKKELFYMLAAALAIATPDGLWKYCAENEAPGGGNRQEWMIKRFKRVRNMTKMIWSRAKKYPDLAKNLCSPVNRPAKVDEIEKGNVPERYRKEVAAVATPAGWALPRLLILYLGDKATAWRVNEMVSILDNSLRETKTSKPAELLCHMAEHIFESGADIDEMMGVILKESQLKDQQNREQYFEVIDLMPNESSGLWQEANRVYKNWPLEKKKSGWVRILDEYERQNRG